MKSLRSKKGFSHKYCDCLYGFQIYKRLFVKSSDFEDGMEDLQYRKAAEEKKFTDYSKSQCLPSC